MQNEARNLFQVQLELIDTKVAKAVNQTISQVVEQIVSLRQEMHQGIGDLRNEMHKEIAGLRNEVHKEMGGLRNEMHKEFSDLKGRMSAVETRLSMKNEWQSGVRTRVLDYSFRAAWLLMGIGVWYTLHSYFSSFPH
ncbi:MAG: hypothetical protein WBE18_04775 [Gammaproteobacteria bacterium]